VPYVRPHYRNGHHVRGHWRRGPGGALGLGGGAVALAVVAVVAALSMASWLSPAASPPQPRQADAYPHDAEVAGARDRPQPLHRPGRQRATP
jgi:hypothetical protein